MRVIKDSEFLKIASLYSAEVGGCSKVRVGSIIAKNNNILSIGANRTMPRLCNTIKGCLRVSKYGDNSKAHRNPDDCRSIHSEIDAICKAASSGVSITEATIYITRYPCEACARAIISSGITTVVYGREQKISEQTHDMFDEYGVEVIHVANYKEEDVLS